MTSPSKKKPDQPPGQADPGPNKPDDAPGRQDPGGPPPKAEPKADDQQDTAVAEQDDVAAEQEELEPEQPVGAAINPRDRGVVFHSAAVRDPDVDVPDDAGFQPEPPEQEQRADDDGDMIDGEQVEYIDAASSSNALALAFNGTTYLLSAQSVAQLKQVVDKAVVGLAL